MIEGSNPSSPANNNEKKERLVYTLVVKDEIETIEDNILFHLKNGVDDVIVTDNGSTDGTLKVLKRLERLGLILLYEDPIFDQANIVNRMGALAREQLHATILIHSDADEFWMARGGLDLKKAFSTAGHQALLIPRINIVPHPDFVDQPFPQENMLIVLNPRPTEDLRRDCEKHSMFVLKAYPKVMFSVKDKLHYVSTGNHDLVDVKKYGTSPDLWIYHFPFKSRLEFKKEIIKHGRAMEIFEKNPDIGWHIRDWYEVYKRGDFRKLTEKLIPRQLVDDKKLNCLPFSYRKEIIDC